MPSGNALPQQQQLSQQQQQQHQQRLPGNMNVGNNNNSNGMQMNNFMQMNPSMSNPAQMQQLAQMQALLRSGGMAQMQQNNPLMRSVSAGNTGVGNNNGVNMMGGFGGQASSQGQGQQNPMAMASMMGPNMMGLQAPPVLPGRTVSAGSMPNGFPNGFNPSMPPPQGNNPPGNNAFSQFNWRANA